MQVATRQDLPPQLEGFADFVRAAVQEWQVPGAAVAIVTGDMVVFCQGFGLRDRASGWAVSPHTLFPIASCTKAFTTLGLALLVDEGRLDWDTPVRTYLPDFALHDPVATARLTPRDLVTHRSGLPRHDFVWYQSTATRQELFERLRYLEPSKDLRTTYQYNNLMYMAAGHLIDRLSGRSWEDFTRARILEPLGMTRTLFSVIEAQQTEDFARPHKEKQEEIEEIAFYEQQGAVGPAGAIVSSVAEMSQWLLLHLNKGRHNGRQLVSTAQMAELHAPQIALPGEGKYAELPDPTTYGLGWIIQPYRGHTILHHSGGINGFSSLVTILPQVRLGVVVLNNLGSPLPFIVTFNALDRLLDLDQVPWSARFMKDHREFKQGQETGRQKSASDAMPGTRPSHPLEAFTGDFTHPAYGTLSVSQQEERLLATLNGVTRPLSHYHYDIFELTIEEGDWDLPLKLSFATNVRGDIASVSVPLEPAVADIVFQRGPNPAMTERRFLERFVGEYELMDAPLTIALRGERTLLLSWPGEPAHELVPYKGTEFSLKDLSGFSIEFRGDASGAVTEALLIEPWAVLTAKKRSPSEH